MAFTLETVFKIGAVFTGAAAMSQAQEAVTKLEQKGLLANLSLKKMAVTLGGLAAGYMTVDKLTGFINSSIDAARKAKAAYTGISDALGKIPQLQKLGTAAIKDQTDKLSNLSKAMEKAGGIAAESLAGAFSKFVETGMSPARINAISGAFQDLVVRVKGIKATADDAATVAQQLGEAIVKGGQEGGNALVQLGVITADQVEKFANLRNANQRYNYTLGEMGKKVGDTAAAMKTWDGVQVRFQNAWKQIKLAIGTPFMEAQDKITEKMTVIQGKLAENAGRISAVITPIITKYADKLGDFLVKLVDNIDKYGPQIEKLGDFITKAFSFVMVHGKEVTAGVAGITGALGVFGTAGMVSGNITKITTAITGLKGAWDVLSKVNVAAIVGVMTNPATWVIVGIAALAAGIYLLITHWEDVKKAAAAAWDAIVKTWGNAWKWMDDNVVKPIVNLFSGLVEKIKIGDLWGIFVEWIKITKKIDEFIIGAIVNSFAGLVNLIGEALGKHNLWEVFVKWSTETVKWIKENVIDKIVELFTGLPKRIGEALSGLGAILKDAFVQGWEKVAGWGKSLPFIGQFFGSTGGAGGAPGAGNVGTAGAAGGSEAATAGTSSAAMGVGSVIGGTKFTHYGYVHDSTPDWNSAHGIGDRNNRLVDRYSVALTKSERLARFGTRGHSTGQTFAFAGGTYRDDDTAPESDRRIDLYDPTSTAKAAYGGFFAHPALTAIAERVPEAAIPLEGTSRSRSLLGAAAERIGMGGTLRGGGSPIHLNMSAPITIHGVQAGQEGAIAREVQKALQDPIRDLLEQLKKAKQYESRLAYA